MKPGHMHVPGNCRSVAEILSRVGDKWTVLVVSHLGRGPCRFNELKRQIDGVSQRMLTLTLRGLERDGLLSRTVYPSIPPRVEYTLTDLGRSLLLTVQALGEWAIVNRPAIETARLRFDLGKENAATPERRSAAA